MDTIQAFAAERWTINVGQFRHICVSDASADMVRATAEALSAANPSDTVTVTCGCRIRAWFKAGKEVDTCKLSLAEVNPFEDPDYRDRWERMATFPVICWVEKTGDGQPRIL